MSLGASASSLSGASRAGQWMLLDQLVEEARGRLPADSNFALLTPAGRQTLARYLDGGGRVVVGVDPPPVVTAGREEERQEEDRQPQQHPEDPGSPARAAVPLDLLGNDLHRQTSSSPLPGQRSAPGEGTVAGNRLRPWAAAAQAARGPGAARPCPGGD